MEDEPAVRRELSRAGYQVDDFSATHASFVQSRFIKTAAIMHHLRAWEAEYRGFTIQNADAYRTLREGFDLVSFKTIRTLKGVTRIHAILMQNGKHGSTRPMTCKRLIAFPYRAHLNIGYKPPCNGLWGR
jgi:hypothetical protein